MTWKATYLRAGSCRHPECMVLRGGRLGPREFPSLVVLLEHPEHGRMLFDVGYSERFHAATRSFPERLYAWVTPVTVAPEDCARSQLAARGIAPADIGTVVLSHLHGDHVAGLGDFPGARLVVSRAAWQAIAGSGRWRAVRQGYLRALLPHDFQERARWIEDLQDILPRPGLGGFGLGRDLFGDGSFVLVELPGHAPGHFGASFLDARRGETFLLADAAWTRESLASWRPPHRLADLVAWDPPRMRDTLRKLVALRAERPELVMVPSHCARTIEALHA